MVYNQVTELMDLLVDKETIDIDRILHIKQMPMLGIEEYARNQLLESAFNEAPILDPTFLHFTKQDPIRCNMEICEHWGNDYGELSGKGYLDVQLPRFGIYRPTGYKCVIELNVTTKADKIKDINVKIKEPKDAPSVLEEHLSYPFSNCKFHLDFKTYNHDNAPHTFRSIATKSQYLFESTFNGFLPNEIREKIDIANIIFGDMLYIVSEVDEWDCSRPVYIKDPLLIGIRGDKCFLIESFNTTPLETIAMSEFMRTKISVRGRDENN